MKTTLKGPKYTWLLNDTKYTKALHKNLEKLWMDAGREAVLRMASPDVIKVLTGMSKGSLLPLARKLRIFTSIRSGIRPTERYRQGYFSLDGSFIESGTQSIIQGERLGQKAFVLKTGTPKRPVFRFEFRIVVYQYALYEKGYKGKPAWNSLDKGMNTFTTYIQNNWQSRVPSLTKFLATGEIENV